MPHQGETGYVGRALHIEFLDRFGRVLTWNAAAERLFGWREDEIRGQSLAVLSSGDAAASAVMTGKYPARMHITDWIAGSERPFAKLKIPDWRQYLPHEEVTIAEAFKANGYATCHIGKWHLGGEQYGPTTQGFDINIAGTHAGSPPTYFFHGAARRPFERAAADRATPPLARRWGLLMNMPWESFSSHFSRAARL